MTGIEFWLWLMGCCLLGAVGLLVRALEQQARRITWLEELQMRQIIQAARAREPHGRFR